MDLIGRIEFYIAKLSGRGWLMPNIVSVLEDSKKEIERLKGAIEFVRSGKHKDGAYIGLPEAVHTYDCRYWRTGASHGPCVCGGVELQAEIDLVFGPYGGKKKCSKSG